jgi:type VI secretion system secreted protein VgrG
MATVKTQITANLTSSSFDCSAMQIREVRGREAISEPFVFEVEVLIPGETSFQARTTLGKDVQLAFLADGSEVRHINGIVAEAVDGDPVEEFTRHRFRIVPRLHRLTLNYGCEVFLDKSVLDITREKLARVDLAGGDITVNVVNPPKPCEFRLQYCETDLAFVSRHLEDAGIAYSFDQSGDKDVLVLSDNNDAFGPAVGPATMIYVGRASDAAGGVLSLTVRSAMMAKTHVVNDYLPSHPKLDLAGQATVDVPFSGEIIDFGTGQLTAQEGKDVAQIRAQSRHALADGVEGESTLPSVQAARTIAVDGHPHVGPERLLVVWVEHLLTQTTRGHGDADPVLGYTNRFRAIEATLQYRPALRTPRPRVSGFVTAVTDVPKGTAVLDTAILDEHGRYTVHFLFDRADDKARPVSSARVRMMQPHAGAGYGMHFPLKPGIEVAVVFNEGDPDRPLIAGAVPNALTWSPAMDKNAKVNHLKSVSGIYLRMKDA